MRNILLGSGRDSLPDHQQPTLGILQTLPYDTKIAAQILDGYLFCIHKVTGRE